VPLRHGHAISIDMAYSATLANIRGLLSDVDYERILNLFSRAGLSMDHHDFNENILDKGTKQILKTRDGKLRAAVPSPLGSCEFLNDVSTEEMFAALRKHKEVVKTYPRNGEGLDAFVDASDTGYTMNDKPVESQLNGTNNVHNKKAILHDDSPNGVFSGGAVKGMLTKKIANAINYASGPETDGLQKHKVDAHLRSV
jgi:3-dehydroquinate synthase